MNILLVDGTNLFLRNYAAVPSLDSNGNPSGGIQGTLLSLRKILGILKTIDKIVFVWDGQGGSKKRRAIVSDYKNGRKPVKLNRNFEFEEHDTETNKLYQTIRVRQYIEDLPVHQVVVNDIEADDVISVLCKYFKDDRKVIASNDKDFVQLLDKDVILYSTSKKKYVFTKDAYEENGIYPINFALARAITGDKSDNLKGVGQVGLKTLLKLFPFFGNKERITLDNFFEYCSKEPEKYKKFLEKRNFIEDNYKIMRLDDIIVSSETIDKIIESSTTKLSLNATNFRKKLMEDGLAISDNFLHAFKFLEGKENDRNEVQK